jgi:hypothetical protein
MFYGADTGAQKRSIQKTSVSLAVDASDFNAASVNSGTTSYAVAIR